MRLASDKKERKAARSLRYDVTLPDGRIKQVTLDAKASGHDCLQMVCNSLGVADEAEYLGLAFSGTRGEELWVNGRNRLAKQVPAAAADCRPRQLRLAVRFFVQPHMLVLPETRDLFLIEARRRVLERQDGSEPPPSLELAASSPTYGCHYFPARDCFRVRRFIGVDPQAVYLCREDRGVLERFAFPRVQKVTKSGRLVYLSLSSPDGSLKELGFRLATTKAATGLYRCVTETHSFFRCDSVRSGVSDQKCRDFKAALASLIFTDADASVGPKFVFDVRKTAREVHDSARRRQFRLCLAAGGGTDDGSDGDSSAPGGGGATTLSELRRKLDALLQEQTCRLCADHPASTVLVPCGHIVACASCADKLADCPLCRHPVTLRQPFQLAS